MLNFNATDKYKTISTEDLINDLKNNIATSQYLDFTRMTRKKHPGSNTKHIVEIPLKELVTINGDKCLPKLLLINSYNRESSLFIGVGLYRFVCTNGLIVGEDFYSQKIRHIKGQKVEHFLNTYQQKCGMVLDFISNELSERMDILGNTKITPSKIFEIIKKLEEKKKITKSAADKVHTIYSTNRFNRPEDAKHKDNLWGLFNVVNECIEDSRTTRTSDMTIVNKNQKLLDNLIKMAA